MVLNILALLLSLSSCGPKHHSKPAQADSRLADLETLYAANLEKAKSLRDPETGWLDRMGCDSMIWNGEYASAKGVEGVKMETAEYPASPGRFARRPLPPDCWSTEYGDQGAQTTWSRDMGIGGLLPYAWGTSNSSLLLRHISYGSANSWQMGEPLADGRVIYTPAIIGLLYKMRHALAGETSAQENWPSVYPSGLTDYEAHLQVKTIWLQGRIANALHDASAVPHPGGNGLLDISDSMYQRLVEHAQDTPPDAFFSFALAEYDGNFTRTLDLLLDPAMPRGSFVRCDQLEQCTLAHWIFVASLTIDALKSAPN